MHRTRLGATELYVSPACLGTSSFGWTVGGRRAAAVLDAFLAGGGNFIDTADVYPGPGDGRGGTETMLGEWLRTRRCREQVVLATKLGGAVGLSSASVRSSVDGSLRRLGVDHVDLLYTHVDDPDVPIEETLGALWDSVAAGKARFLGASNIAADRLDAALSVSADSGRSGFAAVQPHYNLVHRSAYESELRDICATHGLACVPYRALAAGALGGTDGGIASADRRRTWAADSETVPAALSSCLERVAAVTKSSPASIAFRWLLAQATVVAPVFGTASPTHVREILDAAATALPSELVEELSAAGTPPS